VTIETEVERRRCPIAEEFTISRRTSETATTVVVRLSDGEHTGVGGAAPAAYYGETPDSVVEVLPELCAVVESVDDPHAGQAIERGLREAAPGAPAARAAVSTAVHDLAGRRADEPLYRRWGMDPGAVPATSYTVGIADPAEMADRAARASDAGYPVLKLKVGTDDDRARVRAVREAAPDVRLRVDANGAWEPAEAVEKAAWLAEYAEFLEQPAGSVAGLRRVREAGHLPVAADESCVTAGDVPRVADAADIVVVKLAKCGGLRPALAQIAAARAHDLDVMIGCMVASDAAIAPACHVAPLTDYVDLDGALLLAEDPYDGVPIDAGEIDLRAVDAGTGVRRS
jgi:L-alanine-DL-glutamate epimerase-like enolase superfamily enzyme